MKSRTIKFLRYTVLYALLMPLLLATAQADNTASLKAEIAYSASDGMRNEIFTSTYDGFAWSEPEQVTNDNANNVHPAIDIDQGGNKYLFWTAIDENGTAVKYAIYNGKEWSEAKLLAPFFASSITPSVAVDKKGRIWIVFAGHIDDDDDDDIYFVRLNKNEEKQTAQFLHKTNAVPDITPFIAINDQGNPVVSWKGFRDEVYSELQSTWSNGKWGEEIDIAPELANSEEMTEEESAILLPDFIDDDSQVCIRVYK
ncbi:sialidase family protein [Desulfogranum marinum]|uniref:sialidase family protein n=1 Tax=Desulfogranum marinum TaxID=453220 RepID=UPI0029C70D4C|nr:sialidase family protein [Desulfogranum marinum]